MKPESHMIAPAEVSRQFVLAKFDYFINVQIWPFQKVLKPRQWLDNFSKAEMEHAIHLLNSFLYFSEVLINEMFMAAFHEISNQLRHSDDTFSNAQSQWNSFLDDVIVTYITADPPRITDKGIGFASKAKQLLGIPEDRILSPEEALQRISQRRIRQVVIVDDFVETGEDLIKAWKRRVKLQNSSLVSLEEISIEEGSSIYYCPLFCTESGYNRIIKACRNITIIPVHILSHRYSALAEDSLIWPRHLLSSAYEFLRNVSARAKIPDTEGLDREDWRGFNKLGLTIAFSHFVPDATLPIFYWDKNGWKPLINKT